MERTVAENRSQNIVAGIVNIVSGTANRLFLTGLSVDIAKQQANDSLAAMWEMLQVERPVDRITDLEPIFTTRDFIKTAFAELGIEVEFSGKNEYEKGVIIDVSPNDVLDFGLNADVLMPGQTVISIG
ncbi:MAG: GDP-mannose 4,6-dehydratase [Bacteroidota bacterium]